jgi:hypothetical protein
MQGLALPPHERGGFGMPRVIVLLGAFISAAHSVPSQERVPVDIAKEPHHHVLLENRLVRAFAVAIPPREESYVRHESNFLAVAMQDGEVVMWREGAADVMRVPTKQGDARFFWGGFARGMRNESTAEYRSITIEFLDPRVTTYGYRWQTGRWDYGSNAIVRPVDPLARFVNQLDLEMAVVSDVQLLSKDSLDPPKTGSGEIVIALTPLELSNGNDAGIQLASGEVRWLDHRISKLENLGAVPARFVVIAFRPNGRP